MVLFAPMPGVSDATTPATNGIVRQAARRILQVLDKGCKKKKSPIFPPPIKPTCSLRPGFTRLDDAALDWGNGRQAP